MRKSIFVLSILMPAIAHSAVTETSPSPSPTPSTSLIGVSSLDLKDAKLSLDLTAEQIIISGNLPRVCADRLSLSDVKRNEPSKSTDELKDVVLEKTDDLKDYATTIQVQVTYSGDDQNPTLRDCLSHSASTAETTDLSKDPRFSRTVSLSPVIAIAGIIGEPMLLKSPEYIKMEKQIDKLDCKDCNSNWKLLSTHLMEAKSLNSPLLTSMMNKLFEGALSDMDKKIDDAANLSALERTRNQLVEMGDFANTDDQRNLEIALFEKIIVKNNTLATTGFKTAAMATHHADFDKDTYTKMAELHGLSDDKRDELKEKASSMAPGKEERLQYLSNIDGDHPEIKKYLQDSNKERMNLQANMQRVCMGRMNQYKFTQCGELQNKYNANQQRVEQLQSRFTLANNQNWNGIFSYWDKKNIAYDHNWQTTFIQPNPQFSSNSMPDVYDPKDKRYSNFDASKMYQTNAVMPEMNPLFSEQPYSITPVIQ